MKKHIQIVITCLLVFASVSLNAQDKYAAPDGLSTNTGDIDSPWDLQTGLNNITPGHTLYLRDGVYNGRFHTMDNNSITSSSSPITVTSYPGEWAILNGNDGINCTYDPDTSPYPHNPCVAVIVTTKHHMIYENFEITYLGEYTRDTSHPDYRGCTGINQNVGTNCQFINLVIHDLPTNGIGTWNTAGGTEIYGCLIYNVGNQVGGTGNNANSPGSGTGIYAQNSTDLWKNFKNNIFFNNFKVAAKLWSASTVAPRVDFLKNLNFDDNAILNSGSPLNVTRGRECFIIAGKSETEGEGIVHDVNVNRNFMYHNTDYSINNHAEVFRIGTEEVDGSVFYNYAHDINVLDNYFIGRKEGLRFIRVEDLVFKRNFIRSDYVYSVNNTNNYSNIPSSTINTMLTWDFDENKYFSKNSTNGDLYYLQITGILPGNSGKRTLTEVTDDPPIGDLGFETLNSSNHAHNQVANQLGANNTISIVQNFHMPNRFKIVAFDKNGNDVVADFSSYGIPEGTPYTIRDAENYFEVIENPGYVLGEFSLIKLPMNLQPYHLPTGDYPLKATITAKKSDLKVGVFIVDFGGAECTLDLVFQDETESGTEIYEVSNSIITAGSGTYFNVNAGADITHKAGNFVLLQDGTHIKEGSKYLAEIYPCTSTELDYVGETYPSDRKGISQTKDDGLNDELEKIKVFPNPATAKLTVSSLEDMSSLVLTNTLGRSFLEMNVSQDSSMITEVNLSGIPSGMYFLRVTLTSGEIITKQIIKK